MRIFRKGVVMTANEAIELLKLERWKCNPENPLPQWLIDKDDRGAIADYRKENSYKYEALTIAIKAIYNFRIQ